MNRYLYALSIATLSFFGILILYGFYAYNRPVNIYEIYNEPIPLEKSEYKAGETPQLVPNFRKLVDGPSTISVSLIGPSTGPVGSYTSDVPPGSYQFNEQTKNYFRTLPLPLDVSPGTYFMKLTIRQRVNLFRVETLVTQTEYFEVIPGRLLYLP